MKTKTTMAMVASGLLLGGPLLGIGGTVLAGVTITEVAPEPAPAPKATPLLIVYGGETSGTPYAPTGWMGNMGAIGFNDRCTESPHSGPACIKLEFKSAGDWGGIAWQDPPNDWGDRNGGRNLTGAIKLTFWARGSAGGERVDFFFGAIKSPKPFFDTDTGKISTTLTTDWKQYTIDLTGKNLTRIKTGFGWSLAGQGRPVTFYLDDIQYE
jgi:hypothetical protein